VKLDNTFIKIIKDAYRIQHYNNNGELEASRTIFSKVQIFIIILSLILYFGFEFNISENLISYLISALSIIAGIFLTLVISIFDKFLSVFENIDVEKKTIDEKTILVKRKNYYKKFTTQMSYAIVVSILAIILMSCKISSHFLNTHIYDYQVLSFSDWNLISLFRFIKVSFLAVFNLSLFYFLFDITNVILNGFSSIYVYYIDEIDKVRIIIEKKDSEV